MHFHTVEKLGSDLNRFLSNFMHVHSSCIVVACIVSYSFTIFKHFKNDLNIFYENAEF